MIDAPRLLKDLQRLLRELEDDLRERAGEVPEVDGKLRAQYREAKDAERTGQAYEVWREEYLTQVAVAWILGCVFVRFMEDNGLVETPWLSGPGERRQRALDQHERCLAAASAEDCSPQATADALEGLKFNVCLPQPMARRVVEARLADPVGMGACLKEPIRFVVADSD